MSKENNFRDLQLAYLLVVARVGSLLCSVLVGVLCSSSSSCCCTGLKSGLLGVLLLLLLRIMPLLLAVPGWLLLKLCQKSGLLGTKETNVETPTLAYLLLLLLLWVVWRCPVVLLLAASACAC